MNAMARLKYLGTETYEVFNRNKTSWAGLLLLLILLLIALLAPVLAPYNPVEQNIIQRLQPPSSQFLLGTDYYGRDVLSRIIWGCRVSFVIGSISVGIAMFFGTIFGSLPDIRGGILTSDHGHNGCPDVDPDTADGSAHRCHPWAEQGEPDHCPGPYHDTAICPYCPGTHHCSKEQGLCRGLSGHGFFRLAHPGGAYLPKYSRGPDGHGIDLDGHCSSNRSGALLHRAWCQSADGNPWGHDSEGFKDILSAPWASLFPGLVILLIVFSANLLGDGLRDALDPKLRNEN
jgi:peptide/nickel transport system permease protein